MSSTSTEDAATLQDQKRFKQNIAAVDQVTNGDENTLVTTPDGQQIMTLKGMQKKLINEGLAMVDPVTNELVARYIKDSNDPSKNNPAVRMTSEAGGKVVQFLTQNGLIDAETLNLNKFDYGVDDSTRNPALKQVLMLDNGVYSVVLHDDSIASLSEKRLKDTSAYVKKVTSYSEDKINDAMWSYWVYPKCIEHLSTVHVSAITSSETEAHGMGKLRIYQQNRGSHFKCTEFDESIYGKYNQGRTDDHNAPAILLDPRAGAANPLTVFQNDHSAGSVRMWQSETDDASDLSSAQHLTDYEGWTYAQVMRNPHNLNDVYLLCRNSGSSQGVWWLLRSRDNCRTFTKLQFLSAERLYVMMRVAKDNTGIVVTSYNHPSTSQPQKITQLKLEWSGDLKKQDTKLANINTNYSVIDPLDVGHVIYTPSAGKKMRLLDCRETAANVFNIVIAEYDSTGIYKHIEYDAAESTTTTHDLTDCGQSIGGVSSYFAGAVIYDQNTILATSWDGTQGTLSKLVRADNTWSETVIETSDKKIFRPEVVERVDMIDDKPVTTVTNQYIYIIGDYEHFETFNTSLKTRSI